MTAELHSQSRAFCSKRHVPLTEKYYQECTEQASSYNARLSLERRLRQPFLDSQTGVAQAHCALWLPYRYRDRGDATGHIYTYPAKRWKKKKREFPLLDVSLTKASEVETGDAGNPEEEHTKHSKDMHQISAVENPAAKLEEKVEPVHVPGEDASFREEQPFYYEDWENLSDPPDAGEIDDRNSDSSDFEETYTKKKKKGHGKVTKVKPKGGRGRKRDDAVDEVEKPYHCEQCGARYKTRPGLSYHVTHSHGGGQKKKDREREKEREREREREKEDEEELDGSPKTDDTIPYTGKSSRRAAAAAANAVAAQQQQEVSKYCDFCLGDEMENKKTGLREELVSCADCGRSGHPSCLQFTPNMIISVKKYPWQCIECKSCGLCGTSDNDDQLLFCDDCDRGYHMYCLNPPLYEPPEGSWSCHLCINEFYGGKKPDQMVDSSSL